MSGAWLRRARLAAALGRPMPTKQTAPLWSLRAAAMVIISSAVYSSSIGRGRLQTLAKLREIFGPENVPLDPGLKAPSLAGNRVPLLVEGVVARIIALRVRGERAAIHQTHSRDGPGGKHERVRRRIQLVHDFFHGYDGAAGGQCGFFLHAYHSPHQHVATLVGSLSVNDGHVRTDGRNGGETLACERAFEEFDTRIIFRQIGSEISAQHSERKIRGAGGIGGRHPRMAVFFEFERAWPAVFHGVAKPVQRSNARIATPGKYKLVSAACAD